MRNQPRTYKQPRRINAVSVTLLLLLIAAGYVAFSAWPVISLNTDLKSALEDALPKLYRANLLAEPDATTGSDQIRQVLIERMTELGVAEPEPALTISRDEHFVSIAIKFVTAIDLKLIGKKIPVTLNPRVETAAARVSF